MRRVCRKLEGAFTLVAVDASDPDVVVGARRNSPLVVGRGAGRTSSPVTWRPSSSTPETRSSWPGPGVELRRDGVTVTGFDGKPAQVREYHVDWDVSAAEKGGYDYFMLKEIAEQPRAVADTLLGRVGEDGRLTLDEMRISGKSSTT